MKFLPAGPIDDGSGHFTATRKRSLVQVWTDYGIRTVAVADVWGKDPMRFEEQW